MLSGNKSFMAVTLPAGPVIGAAATPDSQIDVYPTGQWCTNAALTTLTG
jgi:hypothetical protein